MRVPLSPTPVPQGLQPRELRNICPVQLSRIPNSKQQLTTDTDVLFRNMHGTYTHSFVSFKKIFFFYPVSQEVGNGPPQKLSGQQCRHKHGSGMWEAACATHKMEMTVGCVQILLLTGMEATQLDKLLNSPNLSFPFCKRTVITKLLKFLW